MGFVKVFGAGITAIWLAVSCVGAGKDTANGVNQKPDGSSNFSANFGKNLVETGVNGVKGAGKVFEGFVEGIHESDDANSAGDTAANSKEGECTSDLLRKDPDHYNCQMR